MNQFGRHVFFTLIALCGGFYIFFYRTIDSSVPHSGDLLFPSGQAQYVFFDDSMRTKNYPKKAGMQANGGLLDSFKRLYEKNSFAVVKPQAASKIPKLFHYIWFGIKLPDEYRPFLQSWLDKHPDWTFIFWVDNPENYDLGTLVPNARFSDVHALIQSPESKGGHFVIDVKNLRFDNRVFFDGSKNYGERSDILRYEVVYRFGGAYMDVDFECFKPLDMLHHMYDFYVGIQPLDTSFVQLGAALFGAIPRHPILEHCVRTIKDDRKYKTIIITTGPLHFTKSFLAVAGKTEHIDVALPASYFYPRAYEEPRMGYDVWQKPESFATHHWAGSWLKKEGWAKSV